MLTIGVSNVSRSSYGERYILTRNNDSRIVVGYVEVTGSLYNVRSAFDEPVEVGSPKYNEMVAAVKHFQEWGNSKR